MKNRSINMFIVGLLLFAVMAVMLFFFLWYAEEEFDEKNLLVEADGVTENMIPIRDLRLSPTESKEYSVNLVCLASGKYEITLDYEETEDGGMKPFVDVIVQCNGIDVYEGTLTELLSDGKQIQFEGTLEAEEPTVVTVIYKMPGSVGNEAQGTFTDFDIHFRIRKL